VTSLQPTDWEKLKLFPLKSGMSWAPVTHAYKPSYSGGRDQEDRGLKPAWENSL
jgi:hypothetical protein